MIKSKVFVTRRLPQPGLDKLEKECEIKINPDDRVLIKKEIIEGVKGKDGLLCLLTDTIDKEIISAEPGLKMIANYAVGYNNIDVKYATKKNIPVSNTPGVLTETTADMAWALLVSTARRVAEGDRYTRAGKYRGWGPMLMLGQDITEKTLGVIGTGRVGTSFALKSRGFRMKVLYHDVAPNEKLEGELGAKKVSLEKLLQESDFVSVHVPLIPSTRHLIGEKELNLMKPTAVLVNTSRGPVVDEKALVRALSEGKIFSAGLDVYEDEPKLALGLAELENVVLAPHLGSASVETRTKMALMAVENMLAGLKGEIPPNCVNPEVFKSDRE